MTPSWYAKVTAGPGDLSLVLAACDHFEREHAAATVEADDSTWRGQRVAEVAKRLPGIVGYRCNQMFELEAICDFLEIRETATRGARRRHYLEHYNRQLTPTTAEKYVEADDEVVSIAELINQVKLVRNKFKALSKQHEYLHFQLISVAKMVTAGVDDAIY